MASSLAFLVLIVFILLILCFLGMGIGIIIRNKGFKTCGNATIGGERVSCPSCEHRSPDGAPPKWGKSGGNEKKPAAASDGE